LSVCFPDTPMETDTPMEKCGVVLTPAKFHLSSRSLRSVAHAAQALLHPGVFNAYMCMYAYMYICVYVYISVYVYMHIYMYIYTCKYINVMMVMCLCVYIHMGWLRLVGSFKG